MNDQYKMTQENNPEAWAAWVQFCKDKHHNPYFIEEPPNATPFTMFDVQAAFEAGWVGAVREVARLQNEMHPGETDS